MEFFFSRRMFSKVIGFISCVAQRFQYWTSVLISTGYPPPPPVCKILKTKEIEMRCPRKSLNNKELWAKSSKQITYLPPRPLSLDIVGAIIICSQRMFSKGIRHTFGFDVISTRKEIRAR